MTGHRCIVPGCKSDSYKIKHHIFTVPKEPGRLEQWKKAIPRKNVEIKPKQVVCEIHFQEDDIIRNKVMTDLNGKINVEVHQGEPLVKWDYFVKMYDLDKLNPGNLKVCSKSSLSHLVLNSSSKMRVRLAVQILSNSMGKSLDFYRPYCPLLKDSTATEDFCLKMNSTFDALNRKILNEGVLHNAVLNI